MRDGELTRRRFLQVTGAAAGIAAVSAMPGCGVGAGGGQGETGSGKFKGYVVVSDPADAVASSAPAQWAIGYLRQSFAALNCPVGLVRSVNDVPADVMPIIVAGQPRPENGGDRRGRPAESFSIVLGPFRGDWAIHVLAPDGLGIAYALTELADRLAQIPEPEKSIFAFAPQATRLLLLPASEQPANRIRSIMRMFASDVEDKPWFYDREFWQRYLTMLVTHRFNRFNLALGLSYDFSTGLSDVYFFFAYPFLLNVPGYNVRAIGRDGKPMPEEEQKRNLEMLRYISDQAALRGLHFQLGLWTHSYRWTSSPRATYTIDGLNAQTQAPYCRDALHMLLEECPNINGITLRTHGESGVPEGSYDIWKTIMSGISGHKHADGSPREIELDLHAKTMTQQMIDTAHTTGQPVTLSPKFWAEHMGLPYIQSSIREQEMPKGRDTGGLMALSNGTRSFLRYGVGDLLRTDRDYKILHRVWPGTQRLLLWGDAEFAAAYGRCFSFCGTDGVEYFDPLSFKGRAGSGLPPAVKGAGRSGYADETLVPAGGDWEKYAYQYRLLGRLAYNPEAAAETWQRQLKHDFGPAAVTMEAALANASRILPLITTAHDPTAANFNYWPEIYVNMSLYDTTRVGSYGEAPDPKIFANVTSLDPQLFASVREQAEAWLAGRPLGKFGPLEVATQLEGWSAGAMEALEKARMQVKNPQEPAFRRAQIDASIAAGIGLFFGNKFRAALADAVFERTGSEEARGQAIDYYRKARAAWETLCQTASVYANDLTFGPARQLRQHWRERLADIDRDIDGIRLVAARGRQAGVSQETVASAMKMIASTPALFVDYGDRHVAAAAFRPGEDLAIRFSVGQHDALPKVRLFYRHVHQGQRYQVLTMGTDGGDAYAGTVPGEYTKSNFPLQYYFEIAAPEIRLFPGFRKNFIGQPYHVVQPASS